MRWLPNVPRSVVHCVSDRCKEGPGECGVRAAAVSPARLAQHLKVGETPENRGQSARDTETACPRAVSLAPCHLDE